MGSDFNPTETTMGTELKDSNLPTYNGQLCGLRLWVTTFPVVDKYIGSTFDCNNLPAMDNNWAWVDG